MSTDNQRSNWAEELRGWEEASSAPAGGEADWARLEKALPPLTNDRRRGVIWWMLGGILLSAILVIATMVDYAEPVSLGPVATGPDGTSAPLVDASTPKASAAPTNPGGQTTEESELLPSLVNASANDPSRPSTNRGNNGSIHNEHPAGVNAGEPPSKPSTPGGSPATIAQDRFSQSPILPLETGDIEPVVGPLPDAPKVRYTPATSEELTRNRMTFALTAGAGIEEWSIIRSNGETNLPVQNRINVGPSINMLGEVRKGNWGISSGVTYADLTENLTLNRRLRIEPANEVTQADGTLRGSYAIDVKALGDDANESVNVSRRGGPGTFTPVLRLTLNEETTLSKTSIPVLLTYGQRLGKSRLEWRLGAGLDYTRAEYTRRLTIEDAVFRTGDRPVATELANRGTVQRNIDYLSYQGQIALNYRLGASPFSLALVGHWSHSFGDWGTINANGRWLRGLGGQVGFRYDL